jgi:charged multivesicular body protein 5
MKKIFGAKKNKDPPPSIQDATDRVCAKITSLIAVFLLP